MTFLLLLGLLGKKRFLNLGTFFYEFSGQSLKQILDVYFSSLGLVLVADVFFGEEFIRFVNLSQGKGPTRNSSGNKDPKVKHRVTW